MSRAAPHQRALRHGILKQSPSLLKPSKHSCHCPAARRCMVAKVITCIPPPMVMMSKLMHHEIRRCLEEGRNDP